MSRSASRRFRALIAWSVAALLSGTLVSSPALSAEAVDEKDRGAAIDIPETGIEVERRSELLGAAALEAHDDRAYVTMPGPDGISVLRGRADDGYRWERVVRLAQSGVDTDLWVANSCIDPSGTRMAVVYAPRTFTNTERNFLGGAWGAIVDLESGDVTDLGRGYSLAYFNPGCGGGSFAAFTRYADNGATQLASVDLTTGAPRAVVDVAGQVTAATTDASGALVAVVGGDVVRIDRDGGTHAIGDAPGHPFNLQIDARDRLAYLAMESGERASAHLVDLRAGDRATQLASGGLTDIGITRTGDTVYVLGDAEPTRGDLPGVTFLPGARTTARVSSGGLLAIDSVSPAGTPSRLGDRGDVRPSIDALATSSKVALRFIVNPAADASLTTSGNDQFSVATEDEPVAAPAMLDVRPIPSAASLSSLSSLAQAGSPTDPVEAERTCAVPRNDPHNQAFQPKPRQVQWAVDRAVLGQLTETRPANWRNLGMDAYAPQQLIPPVALSGGGTIPPQIMLGVLAQESNLWQASRYTSPGSTGNPIIGDFYGSRPSGDEPDHAIWDIDFSDADCGYGVGQITDGMRLAGRERPGEVALPAAQQRAIALDYTANIAMAVRMLAQKWNQVKAAGMDINDGDSRRIENWFFAVWAYNTGFYPQNGNEPWGVGWLNNPINPIYPANRTPFLDGKPSDSANPQWWPYPEKVMGFAAHSLDLPQTQMADVERRTYPTDYVTAFSTAWWSGEGTKGIENRWAVKPPIDTFCSMNVNACDPGRAFPCTLDGEPRCWWHTDAVWKPDCDFSCGWGQERFDYVDYPSEADALKPELPPLTRQLSFPPNCRPAPDGVIVVDDTTHQPVVEGCTRQATEGSFGFTFHTPDANGSYSGKIDLHQQGGGFNGHFSWTHMRGDEDPFDNVNDRLKITGRWSLDRPLNQWTRVWVHLPDHAAWTEQAAYEVDLGNGQKRTRHLPQRRYENAWVPLGVFEMGGVPAVSLSNKVAKAHGVNTDDIAWDAVGFQPLNGKPKDFVVSLGDSYSSGEGAGAYSAWSDHDGDDDEIRNGCHQSDNAWINKTTLPGDSSSIGERVKNRSTGLDFHFLACSGAETIHVMPGGGGQYGLVSQLDAGYLDENTTLVTLSIGGNDLRFGDIIANCVLANYCADKVVAPDTKGILDAARDRLANELPGRLRAVIAEVRTRAPNATIALVGYPRLFDIDTECVKVGKSNIGWLNEISDGLRDVIDDAAKPVDPSGDDIVFVNPQSTFQWHTLCSNWGENGYGESGITGFVLEFTPGDKPFSLPDGDYVSQQSVHPNQFGTGLYAQALQSKLAEVGR